jgi:ABC-type lipoprotein release transport system permease subunit
MRRSYLFKIAALILLRSWRATVVLSFMVIMAVAALVFLSALAIGTNDAMIRNSTGLFSGHIAVTGLREADRVPLEQPGVEHVLIRRHQHILLSTRDGFEPVLLMGIEPDKEKKNTAFWKKTVQGNYPVAGQQTIYLSQEMVKRLKVRLGDTINLRTRQTLILKQLTLTGIYKTGITHLDQGLAFCPAEALPEGISEFSAALLLQPEADITVVAARLRNLLPMAEVRTWMEFMPDLKQLIDLDYICMALVITLVFAIVSVGISCTFLIFTLKNLREHGIMKAMGFMPGDTAWLLTAQIGMLTIFAAAIGTLLGVLIVALFARSGIDISAFTSHNQYFSVSGILYPRLTPLSLSAPPLVAITFGLAAAIWPVFSIIRKNPADILRSV